jgi:hypothetical protein
MTAPTQEEALKTMVRDTLLAAQKEIDDAAEAKRLAEEQRATEVNDAVAAALKLQAKEFAKSRRLPTGDAGVPQGNGSTNGQAPHQTAYADTAKYDSLGLEDLAFAAGVLDTAKRQNKSEYGVSPAMLKALAIRIAEDKSGLGDEARRDLKAAGLDPADVLHSAKANELDYSTQAGFGDEWVGVEYSRRIWPRIRAGSAIVARIPSVEIPGGAESMIIPLEAADPTWYKVAQTTATNATTLRPDATIPTSKLATDQKSLTVAKMAARVIYSNELEEDSLIPWAAQLRAQLETSGAENLEHVVIDGDTDASATTNINDIGGTPAATDIFLLLNGFRKSALVTTTTNSRSAGGSLVDSDFLATIKLMGAAGLNALDRTKVAFILDLNVGWKVLELASIKTHDVFTNATIENGVLNAIWGYPVYVSGFMHFQSAVRKANTSGKVDRTTPSNNTTGSLLAVRFDQWLLGYKRRMTIKIQDLADSDAMQIVATCRVGMAQRDTEGSAITYNTAT